MSAASTEALFHAALEIESVEERARYLARVCADDSLRARVEALLAAHTRAGTFLEPARRASAHAPESLGPETPGTLIGPYRILERIGEGGFGIVYLAEQEEPVRRRVALKVIKLGMDTRRVIARFQAERQALALTDHPHIAKVLDAGATATGRPYFVMELVRGVSIERYCDDAALGLRGRIELFVLVCRAVQHAHARDLVHRDIKPSNVLVTELDGAPVPKVIDFGIAKATSERPGEGAGAGGLSTEHGQLLGTPVYMSPEQAASRAGEVDARSDIYSLGVLLYELLTGTTPFDAARLADAGLAEIQRVLTEEEPPPPSLRVARRGLAGSEAAKRRGLTPEALGQRLRGDLDWIVTKALEKEPARRYPSAEALAGDLLRHLAHEAVHARPPSTGYRVAKFVRRHRIPVLAATVAVVALVGGTLLAGLGFLRASREAARYRLASEVWEDLASGRDVDVAELLERARRAFGEEHGTVAVVLAERAATLQAAGRFEAALPFQEGALRLARELYGEASPRAAVLQGGLGRLYADLGQEAEAEAELRAALAVEDALEGPRDPALCDARSDLARILVSRREYGEAAKLLAESVRVRRDTAPSDFAALEADLIELRNVLTLEGDFLGAAVRTAELLALYRAVYPESSVLLARERIRTGIWLATFVGASEQAERQLSRGLADWRASRTPPRDEFLNGLSLLQRIVGRRPEGRAKSIELLEEWVAVARDVLGASSPELARNLLRLAEGHELEGRPEDAIDAALEGLAILGGAADERQLQVLERPVRALVLRPGARREALAAAERALGFLASARAESAELARLEGALRVRQEDPRAALAAMGRAASLHADEHPVELVVRALAELQLGAPREGVRALVERARELCLETSYGRDAEIQGLVDEAELAADRAR